MSTKIESVETFIVSIPRSEPYLGPLAPGETVNERGYFIRRGNRTLYPTVDRSVLVRLKTSDGMTGWGETYGICAPDATVAIIEDLLAPLVRGRDPADVTSICDEAYDQVRVRGYSGGFYADAAAAIDIALWDLRGRAAGLPLHALLDGAKRERIPAYVSGLPAASLKERCDLAAAWQDKGFSAFKFAAAVSADGVCEEMAALRSTLGDDARIMVDLHWKYSAAEAISLIERLEAFDPYFAEAPCAPEDVDGLGEVIGAVDTPIAAGEEWRTVHDAKPRVDRGLSILQPEMGHTGVTHFLRIAELAARNGRQVIPHASIGIGIFQAASLHAAAAIDALPWHEYQHSVFDRNLSFVVTDMKCEAGYFTLPSGPGLGVTPGDAVWQLARKAS